MEIGKKQLLCLIVILVFSTLQFPAFAIKKSYIVYLGGHSHGREATYEDFQLATNSHHELLESYLGSKEKAKEAIFYSYTKHINGFAALLEEEKAIQISSHPRVVSVFEDKVLRLHTTRSWELLILEGKPKVPSSSIWAKARYGKDTIIGNLDTGVWPESKSFDDRGMGPVPSRWKGYCDNNTKAGVPCNRKLIGARYFNNGYQAFTTFQNPNGTGGGVGGGGSYSARDYEGHGTHTLSTAAGNMVQGANVFGYAAGTAAGGSPAARAAMYKVCWDQGCLAADILAGFDAAIGDGVDVISVSLGGEADDFVSDPIALGSFHAMAEGISVVCSAGNSGPYDGSVANTAPWVMTVGASTLDREFPAYVILGNKKKIRGQSLSSEKLNARKMYPLIMAADAGAKGVSPFESEVCYYGTLDPKKVKGKIVVCLRGYNSRIEKAEEVINGGGIGIILVNDEDNSESVFADPQIIPSTHIGYNEGKALRSYINSTKSPVGTITGPITKLGVKPAPVMASFSSRGPGLIAPQIIKPDITAPGYNILAAYTKAASPSGSDKDKRRVDFDLLSGTSMSCPHVAGLNGLLKTLYPKWSPAAIRSAIMTTARTQDNTNKPMRESDMKQEATPFAYGSGHIQPNRAMDPGLVYDITVNDYLNFLCALGYNSTSMGLYTKKPYKCPSKPVMLEDLNYPSIAVPDLNGALTVTRTVKNVGTPGTYRVHVQPPLDILVSVKPQVLKFSKVGEEKTFKVSFKAEKGSVGVGYGFGMIIWSDGKHSVRSPLAVNVFS